MFTSLWRSALIALLATASVPAWATQRCVVDDDQRELCLAAPAQRIIALSPGATEWVYDAGAGERLVGAVSFSDYPPQANQLPRVGSYQRLDLEALLALQPDLVVAWRSGNPRSQVDTLIRLGVRVYFAEPGDFAGISATVHRLATLAGTEAIGHPRAAAFADEVAALRERYRTATPVTLFYQVWDDPLMTVNDTHFISEAVRLCGGVNLFGALPRLTPKLDLEAVLAADPQVIVSGGMGEDDHRWVDAWRRFPSLQAVQAGHLFFVAPSTLQRPSLRLLLGTRSLCDHLDQVRSDG